MKILELPVDTTITCTCGCKFEFGTDDVVVDTMYADYNKCYKPILVECPFCERKWIIHKVEEADND